MNWERFGIKIEKQLHTTPLVSFSIPLLAILLARLVEGVFLFISGYNPFGVYGVLFKGAFGTWYGLSESIVTAIPLILTGLGVSIAFRMVLWNIGGEGQLYMGAFAASWVALSYPDAPAYILQPAMFMAGFTGGALWGLIPAIPRALKGVNETLTTLMLNYVAIFWVGYLVYGPWRDPQSYNFPITPDFSQNAILPHLGNTRIHAGILIALGLVVIVYFVIQHTVWGYEIRVAGESRRAADYAGINVVRNILLVMLISGGLCGLAGYCEVAGIFRKLQHTISPGYGYTAIIIAWLAKLNPWAIVVVAFLFGGLISGGYTMQAAGLPSTTVTMLQGVILFFVLGGEILTRYRIRFIRKDGAKA
jgi:ABC-type uncharacterized transport system permease subunit